MHNTYADRAEHFRAQAAAARRAGRLVDAAALDALARRATTAHHRATSVGVGLDDIVAVAEKLQQQLGRPLSIGESSAVKAAYHATCAVGGSMTRLYTELTHHLPGHDLPIDDLPAISHVA